MSKTSRTLLILLVAAVVLGIAMPVFNAMVFISLFATDQLVGAIWLVVPASMFSLGCSMTRDRGKMRFLMMSGIGAAWLAWAVWTMIILGQPGGDQLVFWTQWGVLFSAPAVAIAITGMLGQLRIEADFGRKIRVATYVMVWLLAFAIAHLISQAIAYEYSRAHRYGEDPFEDLRRVCGVLAILTTCGLIATIIYSVLPRMRTDEVPASQRLKFTMICPRCGLRKDVQTEGDACSSCGLKIKVVPT